MTEFNKAIHNTSWQTVTTNSSSIFDANFVRDQETNTWDNGTIIMKAVQNTVKPNDSQKLYPREIKLPEFLFLYWTRSPATEVSILRK